METHHWRTVGRVIPWWVARQQSPPLFHLAGSMYRNDALQTRASRPAGAGKATSECVAVTKAGQGVAKDRSIFV